MMTGGLPLIGEVSDNGLHGNRQRQTARVAHSLLLALVALYLLIAYPQASGPIMLLALCGLTAEWLSWSWRRWFIPEGILLISGLVTYVWAAVIDHDSGGFRSAMNPEWAFAGWIRMILMFWALIPSRLHMPKVVAALLAGELLMISSLLLAPWWTITYLLFLIFLSLAVEQWVNHLFARQDSASVGPTPYANRWWVTIILALSLALAASAIGYGSKQAFAPTIKAQTGPSNRPGGSQDSLNLSTTMSLGDASFSDQDPSLTARLLWGEDRPAPSSMIYLRALTTPELILEDERIAWRSSPQLVRQFEDIPQLHQDHEAQWAILFRQRGSQDLVLRPDHSAIVDLFALLGDRDGNLFRRGLGEFPRRYSVDIGAERSSPAAFEDDDPQRYLQVPTSLAATISDLAPEIDRWRSLDATAAAGSIGDWLRRRTQYSISNLPTPLPGPGGHLRAFLWGNADQRQGHCQYYSTATVTLMRLSGHQARPVLGFASDEWTDDGVTFRALHAHAWSEYRDRQGFWQRLDTTPPAGLRQRSQGIPLDEDESWDATAFDDADQDLDQSKALSWLWWGLAAIPVLALAAIALRHYLRLVGAVDARTRRLRQAADALVKCAQDCGISVQPATTLSTIAEELSQRSGVNLDAHLAEHLRARFAQGPMPRPWPLRAIREGYRKHRLLTHSRESRQD